MKLTILGGGGFRVPQVFAAIASDEAGLRIDELTLYDPHLARLGAIRAVVAQLEQGFTHPPRVTATSDLDAALSGADFIFCAIRVGGALGRTFDERIALGLGVLGQETTGPGGLAYAIRTLPVMLKIAERARVLAPDAWFINFTNPAGIVTEGLRRVLGDRVVGICDTPIGLIRRAVTAVTAGATAGTFDAGMHDAGTFDAGTFDAVTFDYVGLNHLGWLRSLVIDGRDRLPDLLADTSLLHGIEEARLMGLDWVRALGALPNEYLYYYYFTRDAVSAIRGDAQTRGEFLLSQQTAFYDAVARDPGSAVGRWRQVRAERDETYMKESRTDDESRDAADVAGGGYEGVALDIMAAIGHDRPKQMILNVRNGSAVPGLPPDAVVEVLCEVDAKGPRPVGAPPLAGAQLGLVQQVKAVERLAIQAARTHSASLAVHALALHPLVDSVTTARVLFQGYCGRIPTLAAVFDRREPGGSGP